MSIDTATDRRRLWIGGYTGEGEGAADAPKGVTLLDPSTGSRRVVAGPDDGVDSPSWLVDTGTGVVAVSERDPGRLTLVTDEGVLAQVPTGAGWPCHAAVVVPFGAPFETPPPSHLRTPPPSHLGEAPSLLAVAHYGGGAVTTVALAEGRLGEVVDVVDLSGHPLGPRSDRQDGAHPHQVVLDEVRGELLVPDLGADLVHRIPLVDGRTGAPAEPVRLPAGFGPRHLVLTGDHVLVVGELSSEIWVGRRDDDPAGWSGCGTTSTLHTPLRAEDSSDPDVGNLPSAIRVDGDVVAIGNRGADRVSFFRLDRGTGSLAPLREVPAHAQWPRDLLLDGDDVWVACERSHAVTQVRWRGPDAGSLVRRWDVGSPTALLLR